MPAHSQAELEYQLQQRLAVFQGQRLSEEQAFGTIDDWIVQLGQRRALLNPHHQKWMWYDRLHNCWVFAGCGPSEAILLTLGPQAGFKRLPQPGPVVEWCIYQQGQTLQGPARVEHLRAWLQTGQVPMSVLVWTPLATDWLAVNQFMAIPA